jgi:hypothetical protein
LTRPAASMAGISPMVAPRNLVSRPGRGDTGSRTLYLTRALYDNSTVYERQP